MAADKRATPDSGERRAPARMLVWIARAVRFGLLLPAAFCILQLAAAELEYRQDTPFALARAASIGKTEYRERLATLQPERAQNILRKAVQLDPFASSAWVSLGLAEEQSTDPSAGLSAARRSLETAFFVDHQYAPAWALANFCFRHEDAGCFWRAETRALLRAPSLADPNATNLGDVQPLLELARRMEPSPATLIDRLTNSRVAPGDSVAEGPVQIFHTQIERALLNDLIVAKQWDDAAIVALRLSAEQTAAGAIAQDRPRLDDLVDRLLAAQRLPQAVDVWNSYSGFTALDPSRGLMFTNGDFSTQPRQSGFDWRFAEGSPRDIAPLWKPLLLEFRFHEQRLAADASDEFLLLEQRLPLRPGKFRLRFAYSTHNLSPSTGIHWEVLQPRANSHAADRSASLESAEDWREGQCTFSVSASQIAPLRLIYHREPGAPRAWGSLFLRHLRWEAL